ncbi:uncharacterized protein DFL_002511 [Arthrobotrys flagrans]|uniref:Uncharacterized protein n=1 Tax=Arthrobotrys flagrans TaxID=97331 RepID=A0A437AB08_ARTFL|nr:hypothetical protein DFL_002511 [Arthrobotrys flagrans]
MLSRIPRLLVRPSANLDLGLSRLANANANASGVLKVVVVVPHGLPRPSAVRPLRYNSTTTTTPSTGKRPVDAKVEDLSELYASAKDEFEIAVEETSKNTIYARDDRETAREEFEKFRLAYEEAVAGSSEEDGLEIRRRVGQRLREMESAMETLIQADKEEH